MVVEGRRVKDVFHAHLNKHDEKKNNETATKYYIVYGRKKPRRVTHSFTTAAL